MTSLRTPRRIFRVVLVSLIVGLTSGARSVGPAITASSARVLPVPHIHQTYDTLDDFIGKGACAPTSAAMILAYYGKILPDPIWVSFPSPGHYTDFGKYISGEYTYGEFAFTRESRWDLDNCGIAVGKGGWGHVWQNGVPGVLSNLQDYLVRHGLDVSFAHYDESSAKNMVQLEIDQGRPLMARTRLTAFGHYVVITGYEIDSRGDFWYKVNDPFGHQPYDEGCWGEYGESQPVSYSYAQMGLGEPSRGLMTISGALRGDLNGD